MTPHPSQLFARNSWTRQLRLTFAKSSQPHLRFPPTSTTKPASVGDLSTLASKQWSHPRNLHWHRSPPSSTSIQRQWLLSILVLQDVQKWLLMGISR